LAAILAILNFLALKLAQNRFSTGNSDSAGQNIAFEKKMKIDMNDFPFTSQRAAKRWLA
jgi:hypothetical protein